MIIKLIQPPAKNWLIVAEGLNDPPTWDRFVPCHAADSQRGLFEAAVKDEAAWSALKLKPCKDMLTRGVSVFEYDWTAGEDAILAHAMQVSDRLQMELTMESAAA